MYTISMIHQGNTRLLVLFSLFVLSTIGLLWWSFALTPSLVRKNTNTAYPCTEEAKLCPDGNTVGRTGSNCEFAECPPSNTNNTDLVDTASVGGNVNRVVNTNSDQIVVPISQHPQSELSVALVTSNPVLYQGLNVCLTGAFQQSFEFNAFGSGFKKDSTGQDQLLEPYIWVDQSVDPAQMSCSGTTGNREQICTGNVTACGIFRYAPTGQPGFGHVQAYRYILE